MKYAAILTYGCQMNVNESAKIKKILETMGYGMTDRIQNADLVLLNTCTVREGAATQIFGKIGELSAIKKQRGTIIGVTGCFAQEQGRALIERFPYVDLVLGNQNIGLIPQMLRELAADGKNPLVATGDANKLPEELPADFGEDKSASVVISYGCDNFCTYCIVPYVRGRERSVPREHILREVRACLEKGHREILLLGQNVNSWGGDLGESDGFAGLLSDICAIPGEFRIRFVSPHPRDFTKALIEVMGANEKIARSVHLPMQSGATEILKRMNRGYTKEDYLALAARIRERIPDMALTTDIIVGFPGESEADFRHTLDVVETVRFDNAFTFLYSPRTGTVAAELPGQIPEAVKKDRLNRLMAVQDRISREINETYYDKVLRVLVEGPSKKNPRILSGRSSTNKIVLFEGDGALKGNFADVRVHTCRTWTLYGNLINFSTLLNNTASNSNMDVLKNCKENK